MADGASATVSLSLTFRGAIVRREALVLESVKPAQNSPPVEERPSAQPTNGALRGS
ncbi:MAG: hypothetical protein LBT05_16150 [Planctomycetaceae bacterium]|nr:hypothetical protein [Planctomycetaceae bacterium]